jgi:glyoxylase I family protein
MTELEATLHSLETQLLQTSIRKNAAQVAALLTDDFVEFGSSGRVWTKHDIVEALQDEALTERSLSEFRVEQLAAGVALVTYRVERRELSETVRTLRSSVWVFRGARWRMRFHQGTFATP